MGINIRVKGQKGERDVCDILVGHGLVQEASRNLDQVREGGSDVEALSHASVEVKRHEKTAIKSWWDQVCVSAARVGKMPCVWWRPNNKKWLVILAANTIQADELSRKSFRDIAVCGKVITKNYPHLQFVHFEDFIEWYKAGYVKHKVN